MFEKEAEEYADGIYHYKINVSDYGEDGKINYRYSDIKEAHQKGAEFGYNKANEWYNPKEKLPTKDCEVLIEYGEHKTHRVVDWDNKSRHFGSFSIDEVTRWKEIE